MSKNKFSLLETPIDFQEPIEGKEQERASIWGRCFISQAVTQDKLICPATNSWQVDKSLGYRSIAEQLKKFDEIGELPNSIRRRIYFLSHEELTESLFQNEAKFHKQCKNRYDEHHYGRATKKRKSMGNDVKDLISTPKTRARYSVHNFVPQCFFCEKGGIDGNLTKAQTLSLDKRVRDAAIQLQDEKLLAKLSAGDMIAIEAVYHKTCLATLYNRLRDFNNKSDSKEESEHSIMEGVVLAEIIEYLRDTRKYSDIIPVLKLSDIKSMYCKRLEEYGTPAELVKNVHSSRLKSKILNRMPELAEHRKGNDILLPFREEVGKAIFGACQQSYEEDGICLSKAAKIIRKQVDEHERNTKNLLIDGCEEKSVPLSLVTLISMIIGGASLSDHVPLVESKTSLNIAQIIRFNLVKKRRQKSITDNVRHTTEQETPFPLFLSLLIHSKTRKRELVNMVAKNGLGVSYDRVQSVELSLTKQLCKKYNEEGAVCPPSIKNGLFTTAAIDNIDHNTSSNTSRESFHGTSISVFQHPEEHIEIEKAAISNIGGKEMRLELPENYTVLPQVIEKVPEFPLQSVNYTEAQSITAFHERDKWLNAINSLNEERVEDSIKARVSWSGYHSNQVSSIPVKSIWTLLPLLHENINSMAMVRHTFNIIKQILLKINPSQCPVITADHRFTHLLSKYSGCTRISMEEIS